MTILKWILEHWDDVLVSVLLVLSIAIAALRWLSIQIPQIKAMSIEERIAYISRLLTNLAPLALSLVTKAETEYGKGTGEIKRSYVMNALYSQIPDEYKKFVTEENLDSIINSALEQAKPLWEENPQIRKLVEPESSNDSPKMGF